eukprot:jgi/Mesvir1/12340/Mv00526-RA.1
MQAKPSSVDRKEGDVIDAHDTCHGSEISQAERAERLLHHAASARSSFSSISSGEIAEDVSLHERARKRAVEIALPEPVHDMVSCQAAVSPSAFVRVTVPNGQQSCDVTSCLPEISSIDALSSRFPSLVISSATLIDKLAGAPDSPGPAACSPGKYSELASFEWISGERFDFDGDEDFFPQKVSPARNYLKCKAAD